MWCVYFPINLKSMKVVAHAIMKTCTGFLLIKEGTSLSSVNITTQEFESVLFFFIISALIMFDKEKPWLFSDV